jgi:hypothetical protein
LIICSSRVLYWHQSGRILDPYFMSHANYLHEHQIWTHLITFCYFVYVQCLRACIHATVKCTIYHIPWIQICTISVISIKTSRRWIKLSRDSFSHLLVPLVRIVLTMSTLQRQRSYRQATVSYTYLTTLYITRDFTQSMKSIPAQTLDLSQQFW